MATNQPPEKKFSYGAIQIAVWTNDVTTNDGERQVRSISVSRRYRDKNGNWQDSSSFRTQDIPVLLRGLRQAWEYSLDNPLSDPKEDFE